MLRETVIAAVAKAESALQNLAIPGQLISTSDATHVPGQSPVYPSVTTDISVVVSGFKHTEVDGERVKATDLQCIMFPKTLAQVAKPNDVLNFNSKNYRVLSTDPVMAGTAVVLVSAHVRPK